MKKPNFFIVGAPKCGTTSLYKYLEDHPKVFMSKPKEVNYFSSAELKKQGLYYQDHKVETAQDYELLFRGADTEKVVGEASVSYLFYEKVPEKIQEYAPDAKILILLRNPIDRAHSHYLMDSRLGYCKLGFDDIVFRRFTDPSRGELHYQQVVELGLYAKQVARYVAAFGTKNVKIYLMEDLLGATQATVSDLYQFMGVDHIRSESKLEHHNGFSMPKNALAEFVYSNSTIRSLAKRAPGILRNFAQASLFKTAEKPKMSREAYSQLRAIFLDDICKLEQLIDRDLSDWKNEND